MEVVEECVHLGITRDSKSRSGHAKTIDERIQSARRCAYSRMGAGLHGQNGVNPLVSFTMWNVFILPCLLYGLDVLTLVKSEIAKITQLLLLYICCGTICCQWPQGTIVSSVQFSVYFFSICSQCACVA